MVDEPKLPTRPVVQFTRSKDFRVIYANAFRFSVRPADVGLAFSYQSELPTPTGDGRPFLQDEVEVVLTPSTLKLLQMALNDNIESLEKVIGTIQIDPAILEAIAKQKVKMAEATTSSISQTEKK